MRFSVVVAALSSVLAVSATKINVTVGANKTLTYQPSSVNASIGDIITFTFVTGNHTITQSSFANPCQSLSGGLDSGFMPTNSSAPQLAQWSFTVTNTSSPMWFRCRPHCSSGMVFAINPTASKSFAAFQAAAESSNSTTPSASSTSPATKSTITATSGAIKMRDSMALLLTAVGMAMGLVLQ